LFVELENTFQEFAVCHQVFKKNKFRSPDQNFLSLDLFEFDEEMKKQSTQGLPPLLLLFLVNVKHTLSTSAPYFHLQNFPVEFPSSRTP
jgi:hypothetical protein